MPLLKMVRELYAQRSGRGRGFERVESRDNFLFSFLTDVKNSKAMHKGGKEDMSSK